MSGRRSARRGFEPSNHQRAFATGSVQSAEVELLLQTRNPAHVREVVAALVAAGFEATAG